jgi:hypothetical protein
MPLQRTRSRALLGRSPLNGGSLGGFRARAFAWLKGALALGVVVLSAACNDPRNVLTISTPAEVLVFQMSRKDNVVIWRIEAVTPQSLRRLRYGELPNGFQQVAPASPAVPPPLADGEELTTLTVEPHRTFTHTCMAVGIDGITCGGWVSAPRGRPTAMALR